MALDSLVAKGNTGAGTDALAGRQTGGGFVGAVMLTDSTGAEIDGANPVPVEVQNTALQAIADRTLAPGQAAMASSSPVVIASDQSAIPVALPNMTAANYSQAGAISINTDLIVLDCQGLEGVSIQCVSMGTSGVVTPAWSNDGATYVAATIMTPAGAAATTFNAAGLWTTPVLARFLRLRLTTAATAGTTSLQVRGAVQASNYPVAAQPISGTVSISGAPTLGAGSNLAADFGLQARANATGAAAVAKVASAASTNATSVKASAGRVLGWQLTNTTAAVKVVRLYNLASAPTVGTSVPVYNIVLPANASISASFPVGIGHAAGISYAITNAIADLDATAVSANDVIGAIYYA